MIKEMLLPNLGEGVETADVSEVLVKKGDSITKDSPILVLESEKATMEIPSDYTGTITDVFVTEGKKIASGQKLIAVETSKNDNEIIPKETKKEKQKSEHKATPKTVKETAPIQAQIAPNTKLTQTTKVAFASPAVRRFARELGADLNLVSGTGLKGRITKEDVQNFIKAQLTGKSVVRSAPLPAIDFSQWGAVETVPLNKIRRITGERMTTAWQTIPQVTNFDKIDITELDTLRRSSQKVNGKDDAKITLLPFLMKAVAMGLKEYPDVNSSLSTNGQELILKNYYNIRIAVDTPEGLMVPVIFDVDKKNIFEISEDLAETSMKARNKRLMPDDLTGGTFTISSLGGIGGTYFTPIVNPPEVAILGVSRAKMEQEYNGKSFNARLILPVTMSYDHRIVDGALAARFMKHINELLSDIQKLSEANIV